MMLQDCFAKLRQKISNHLNWSREHEAQPAIRGKVVVYRTSRPSSVGKSISVYLQLCYSTIGTGFGRLSKEASLRNGKKTKHGDAETTTYDLLCYHEEEGFGTPGAMAVKNMGQHEFFLVSVTLEMPENDQSVHFDCNSWVYPIVKTNVDRLFFTNASYLPNQTPAALQTLRQEELANLRGNGRGQREKWERIYDYDRYNDLGEPDKAEHHVRPILGGSKTYPYPRRCRTGRPLSNQDRLTETRHKIINLDFYVPPDDRFSPIKLSEFISNSIQALVHFVIPEVKSIFEGSITNFESFDQITKDLYTSRKSSYVERTIMERIKTFLPEELFKEAVADENAWRPDEEFGREMLAGLKQNFPPVGKGGRRSSITASHIEKNLEGLSIEEVSIFYSFPPGEVKGTEINRVFLPASQGTEAALWQFAKTHVAVNDSGHHQLISHWLNTHAAVEPFIIVARSVLLNAGGILERTMFPGKFSMELSSTIYKKWRFRDQALPLDLLKRGMAVEDQNEPSGVRLLFEDYPYAADGLDVWIAIKTWVTAYCAHFYRDDRSITADAELQAWFHEVRTVGHGDRRDDPDCWIPLDSLPNLAETLTTLIWIASALHASVNFGQFAYAGFPPNRPTRCRRFVPDEGTREYAEFVRDPDRFFLKMVPDRFTTTLGLALIEVLSGHTSDEVYLGQRASASWTNDGEVLRMFREFGAAVRGVEKKIEERNGNRRLRNRWGPARVPYMLLYPDSSNLGKEKGVTGRGIPNSVSI